jgi:murein DD-endopeptidase MepM/ murein hydrolase activator NlpD
MTRFPLDGINGRDWMINNYVDLDGSSPGLADYVHETGERARTYDGHRGLDIDIPSFRQMDGDLAVVHAAAPGVVDQVIEDQPDRNSRCLGRWNVVGVRHANGFRVLYGHIKRGSARVAIGELVAAGTPLAVAGSAGCSTQPHLHLEVQSCTGAAIETLEPPGMWRLPPVYDPASDIMDVTLQAGRVPTEDEIKDPPADPAAAAPDSTLGVGLSAAARGGDVIAVNLIGPHGRSSLQSMTIEGAARFTHLYPRFALAIGRDAGTWTVEIFVNGRRRAVRTIAVEASRRQR